MIDNPRCNDPPDPPAVPGSFFPRTQAALSPTIGAAKAEEGGKPGGGLSGHQKQKTTKRGEEQFRTTKYRRKSYLPPPPPGQGRVRCLFCLLEAC